MDILKERSDTYDSCIAQIRSKYGMNFDVIRRQTVRMGGFLGFFEREGVEVAFVLSREPYQPYQQHIAAKKDFNEERQKILSVVKPVQDTQITQVLQEVRALKEQLADTKQTNSYSEEHDTIEKLENLFDLNDFSSSYTRSMLDRVRKEFSLESLDAYEVIENKVVEWIGESIGIYNVPSASRPHVIVLVGPTGVGKTTTIAKLAASFGIAGPNNTRPLNVRMITIDNYRIAAKQQIEIYGSIMGIPVSCVESINELQATMALYSQDVDVVLIDTIGRSPKDYTKIAEMRQFLDVSGSVSDVYLALSATTKTSDMREIIQQFETFGYNSVIITKFDETTRVGNVISVLSEKNKTASYITNGQRVPQDIERATIVHFLTHLEGFKIHRSKIEERFGEN